jgi:SAM-dependent methyltransferase
MEEAQTEISREWFEDWFSREEYELVYRRRGERDAIRLLDLMERAVDPAPGARVLDLACGRGRHAVHLARRGYEVTGIDLSQAIIEHARIRARRADLPIRFLQGDMRDPMPDEVFDGIVNLFTSFGYFEEEEDHGRVIGAVSQMLVSGGWFFQDFLNAPYVENHIVPYDESEEGEIYIMQRRWIDGGRVNKEIILQRSGDIHTFTESVRLLTLEDFVQRYRLAGLEIVDVFGSYDGDPLSDESPRLILHARKRSEP